MTSIDLTQFLRDTRELLLRLSENSTLYNFYTVGIACLIVFSFSEEKNKRRVIQAHTDYLPCTGSWESTRHFLISSEAMTARELLMSSYTVRENTICKVCLMCSRKYQ